ncbi:MAG: hypothetical protein A3I07_03990 [Candidatus Doudnabacteria bacterium RIFCSPLOWO2_02_FULL_42_9]|uniref:Ada DNA repair metal-binding domain-containing protein n=1 Tax=Candidatus Doudnabacteria bacterium RIFCSPHIGHO2_01_FULL_41_86 TaxID=1817821 RepID=A0A1F5N845_9BACT|nr:MAG: hypothetical protein A2717_04485 [Candidatus Doudnabacteria bacterium RIFCSPHIGHO2_01_FULL_41_86]OGE75870.1 MAG: hypothetical protein A3K07_04080 [Candidatus Doudnabacteria bacterium RIFCSPHIGHO2_01_43_10]OGE86244.1 MAG: hypothetical protein A3E28_03840 [Candidatus Doudnabacteria bacterium RIFCSPHIGHO2_12_FULL_42_22]OGE87092.1 MAG: hypothetical protein A3C49_03505 [Candidatus Doudnabacteria bacterium RIFCSPHIGHO2_02_FULL_42_25]OGE92232.1 MAG: hypothetical protein A2895_04190 [Candidatus
MIIKEFIKTHQQAIVLTIGYVLVASLGFGLGQFTTNKTEAPEIKVEQAFTPTNYTPTVSGTQQICDGKIKGSKSMIYHLPGGAFYDKTTSPIRCFDTEAEAKSAGFRKSSR